VEAGELQAVGRQLLGDRRLARPAERARRAEAHVVEEDDEDVRRPGRRDDRLDRRKPGVRVLGVERREPRLADVGDGQDRTLVLVGLRHRGLLGTLACPQKTGTWTLSLVDGIRRRDLPTNVGSGQ
jgi:hypothetical protein